MVTCPRRALIPECVDWVTGMMMMMLMLPWQQTFTRSHIDFIFI